MKLVIVGGVAGGASAAARARRLNERAEIVLIERGEYVSFANCGLPYYIGGEIRKRDELLVSTPEKLKNRFLIDVRINSEAVAIDRARKRLTVREPATGRVYEESYDKLILSPGAAPIRPPLPGADLDTVLTLRNIPDTDRIKALLGKKGSKSAVIVGGGFIGLEMAEAIVRRGIKVTVIEMLDQVMAPLDYEMAAIIHNHLRGKGVELMLSERVESFEKKKGLTVVRTASGREVSAGVVILSVGVKPEVELARSAGLKIGERGGITVDDHLRTSDPDVFAVGDAIEVRDIVTQTVSLVPLAGPANKQGRIAADNALGRNSVFKGVQGTSVVRVFELAAASTGASAKTLSRLNRPFLVSFTHSSSHASYYPGAQRVSIKLIFEPGTGKVLGAQVVGRDGVDKRIDVLATAIRAGMTVFDLEELELAYAPPFGSAKDPVNMAGFVAANMLKGDVENVNWNELDDLEKNAVLIDLRDKDELEEYGRIGDALHIPLNDLRGRLQELSRDKTYYLYCAVGLRGYIGWRILVQHGFKARNVSGGIVTWDEPRKDREPSAKAGRPKKKAGAKSSKSKRRTGA
jgi:NADPH-dependent 2,4-dienoyl-CoA reductase/sulfur reductase-like enzyme/rhodanese-related sulfurtransferase